MSREASYLLFGEVFLNEKVRRTLFDTSGFATRRDVSYKVGDTLEEICLLRRGGPRDTVPSTHVCTIRVDC